MAAIQVGNMLHPGIAEAYQQKSEKALSQGQTKNISNTKAPTNSGASQSPITKIRPYKPQKLLELQRDGCLQSAAISEATTNNIKT